ncbi:MAG: tRNA 2-thiouridine(34) synthase MnmA [Rikenellaceae bacterium]|nr:tRNA 2-thiouridine(34) synthase MnmA [Rikenellaceae bacterium]
MKNSTICENSPEDNKEGCPGPSFLCSTCSKKILAAVSGGIDSAATTLLLKNAGFEVTGINFILTDEDHSLDTATLLSNQLGIQVISADLRDVFRKKIISYFTDGYMSGETPAPCSVCNPQIKWRYLKEYADSLGIPYLATGHYIGISRSGKKYFVRKARDPLKDQSYYLWGLGQEILSRAVTPLGKLTKTEVREFMSAQGYEVFTHKKESMSVCFLRDGSYTDFLKQNIPDIELLNRGRVINDYGETIGSHSGFPFYTTGQKRGFKLFKGEDLYVTGIDAVNNTITCGGKKDLFFDILYVGDTVITDKELLLQSGKITVKIRGIGINPGGYCEITEVDGFLRIITAEPVYAPAKGQPAVFYMDDIVVGGGILKSYNKTGI